LTLLAHSQLSNKYWLDAFLTAVHLINRLPTPTLQFLPPFFKLYNREPNYQELRFFGCLCYPLLKPYGLHKLEYRSKPCIFLGYHHVGYKCLDLFTNKVYLSRHVVFDEDSFPAKDQAVSPFPSKVCAQNDAPFILPVQFPILNLPQTSSNFSPVSPSPVALSSPPISPPIATSSPSRFQPPTDPTPHIPQPHATSPSPALSPPTPSLADPCLPNPSSLQPSSPSPIISIPAPTFIPLLPHHSMVIRSHNGSLQPPSLFLITTCTSPSTLRQNLLPIVRQPLT